MPAPVSRYRFGAFELRPAERLLLAHGKEMHLTARAVDVLCLLAARGGALVTKDELLATVWPGLVVEENNLQVQISQLRKAIGAASIATLSGRGYRLTLPCAQEYGSWPASPAVPARLYGRQEELDDLAALAQERRLVSVVGAGGVGKTALARHVTHRVQHVFHAIEWIDLSAAAGAGDVAAALDTTLRTPPIGPALLVLDNADRVSGSTALLAAALLASAPRLHLLVTTQVRLNLLEESVYRLAALAVPTAGTPLGDALDYGALALLQARISALDHFFQLDDGNLADAIDVCRKLDGLPLALELAAAWVPALGLRGLLARLGDGLAILHHGNAQAAARHRSLWATLEWSYALLPPQEQKLLRVSATLPCWFSLEQLMALAPRGIRALDSLATLIDRSFAVFDGARATPYRLTESARAFGQLKLRQAGWR